MTNTDGVDPVKGRDSGVAPHQGSSLPSFLSSSLSLSLPPPSPSVSLSGLNAGGVVVMLVHQRVSLQFGALHKRLVTMTHQYDSHQRVPLQFGALHKRLVAHFTDVLPWPVGLEVLPLRRLVSEPFVASKVWALQPPCRRSSRHLHPTTISCSLQCISMHQCMASQELQTRTHTHISTKRQKEKE